MVLRLLNLAYLQEKKNQERNCTYLMVAVVRDDLPRYSALLFNYPFQSL